MELIGRYQVLSPLGRGGMGDVFLAELRGPRRFRKQFAIKRLRAMGDDPAALERFATEAQIAAWLSHPAVCQVYELDEDEHGPFIVMEYLEGTTLAAILRRARHTGVELPLPVVVAIAEQVCLGLAAAHALTDEDGVPLGVVHRDVSPSNVMITRDGRVKLLDFGVAKVDSVRTQTGIVRGKYAYMSPEQIGGARIDRRSDLFALGAVLFEALSRRPLFAAPSLVATAEAILRRPLPDLGAVRPDVPRALIEVVERALARDPARRPADAGALRDQLRAAAACAPARPDELAGWAAWGAGDERQRATTDDDSTVEDGPPVAADAEADEPSEDGAPTAAYEPPPPPTAATVVLVPPPVRAPEPRRTALETHRVRRIAGPRAARTIALAIAATLSCAAAAAALVALA